MTDRLGHKQTAALFTLMVLAREVDNLELESIVGFRLDGKERRQLNELGLVDSRKRGRPLAHELTDRGWAWCEDEMRAGEPAPSSVRSTLVSALYVLLSGLESYMQREKLHLSDLFAPEVDTPKATPEDVESQIRAAYRKLAGAPRDWVGLAELRPLLGGTPAEAVDAMLRQLSRSGQAHLVPESNRKTLTAADREAAIRIGGEDNHLLSIEAS
ncbi:hypothetical protein SAMN05421504_101307 [Amycolatopsis xylanica]|uniref:Uncharacterized protein n=1 Tax=Amycolatopsis xylanica TaxID=589385 RepID=A0A1H2SQJ8_9PSEU|nr:hypothetical protein [Amycolatopsis xylanica]SDW33933.1 hypothetical protein SAMN05421504_101307 [Amycolatopsis xylanica]